MIVLLSACGGERDRARGPELPVEPPPIVPVPSVRYTGLQIQPRNFGLTIHAQMRVHVALIRSDNTLEAPRPGALHFTSADSSRLAVIPPDSVRGVRWGRVWLHVRVDVPGGAVRDSLDVLVIQASGGAR